MKKTYILLLTAVLAAPLLKAQNSTLAYNSERLPQSNIANPALFPARSGFYLQLPGLGLNFGSPLAYSDIFQYQPGDSVTYVNLNSILDTLSANGRIGFNADVNVVGFGLKLGRLNLSAYSNAHLGLTLGVPSGLATFLSKGNYAFRGEGNELYLLDGELLNTNIYAEAGIGVGYELLKGITIAARPKAYFGYFNLSSANTMLRLYTSENCDQIRADVNYQLRSSGAFPLDTNMLSLGADSLQRYMLSHLSQTNYIPSNVGYGLDLGVRWQWKMLDLSASIRDLGASILWQQNVRTIQPKNGQGSFAFNGIELKGFIQDGQLSDSLFSGIADTLLSMVDPAFGPGESYRTYLPTKLNLSALYRLTPGMRVGLMYYGEFDRHTTKPLDASNFNYHNYRGRTSIVGQINLADWVEVLANISIVDDGNKFSWFNPGLGLNLSLFKIVQAYLLVDYVSSIYLVDARSFHLSTGINLMLINKR